MQPAPRPDLFSRVVGDVESFPLEQRIVHLFLAMGGSLLVLFMPLNAAMGLGGAIQLLTGGLSLVFLGLYWFLRIRRGPAWLGLPVLLVGSAGVVAYNVVADGSEGPGLLFLLVAAFVTSVASRGWTRFGVVLSHTVAVGGLLVVEHLNPSVITRAYTDSGTRLLDLGISWVMGFAILLGFGIAMQRGARELMERLQHERSRAERLLLNVLPEPIASQLKSNPNTLAEYHGEVTVLFADLVGFTQLSSSLEPRELVELLDPAVHRVRSGDWRQRPREDQDHRRRLHGRVRRARAPWPLEPREAVQVKGMGTMRTWLLRPDAGYAAPPEDP